MVWESVFTHRQILKKNPVNGVQSKWKFSRLLVGKFWSACVLVWKFFSEAMHNTVYYSTQLHAEAELDNRARKDNKYHMPTLILFSFHSSQLQKRRKLGKSEFWEQKMLDNESLIRHFSV